ncbi:MAG TPA: hypothetical protein VLE95_02855 [Chlamydiales bacterium]|nr:hypothetical protein [Chlamydiales bacterium]
MATMKFSEDEWTELKNSVNQITYGLNKGEDFAVVLAAVATLPKDKRNFCYKASGLISQTMSAADRVSIVNALATIDPRDTENRFFNIFSETASLSKGLKSGADIAEMMKTLAGISQDRSSIFDRAKQSIKEDMTIEERVEKLNEAETAHWYSPLCDNRLHDKKMSPGEKVQLKRAIEALPDKKIDRAAQHLVTQSMGVEDRFLILHAVAALSVLVPSSEQLGEIVARCAVMSDSMNAQDRVQMLNAVAALPLAEQKDIVTNTGYFLVTNTMNVKDRERLLNAVAILPAGERGAIITSSRWQLFPSTMSAQDKVVILEAVAALPAGEWRTIVTNARDLITSSMNAQDKAQILNAVAALPSAERETIINHSRNLITDPMSVQDRVQILNAVAPLSPAEREAIITSSYRLMTAPMSGGERVRILSAVAPLPSAEREAIVNLSLTQYHEGITIDERLRILAAVAAVPSQFRILIYVTNPAALSVDARVELLHTLATHLEAQSAPDTRQVLHAVAALRPQEQEQISTICQRLFNQGMNVGARLRVLAAVAALSEDARYHIQINSEALTVDELVEYLHTLPWRVEQIEVLHAPQEILVNIDQLGENPKEVLENLIDQFDIQHAFPKVRFQTAAGIDNIGPDAGIDGGGVSRTLVTELMKALCHPEPPNERKLPMLETEKGLIPRMEDPLQLKSYRSIGMIFATALRPDRLTLTGSHFHPVLFQMIHTLTREEVDRIPLIGDIPQDIQNKLLKLYMQSELRQVFGDANMPKEDLETAIHDFLNSGTINNWMRDVSSIESKEGFLSDYQLNQILLATCVIAKSMQQCIETPDQWELVKAPTAEQLQKKVQGALTKELVRSLLKFSRLNEPGEAFVTEWIDEATPEQLENFVFCISGSTTLTADRKLSISFRDASSRLPSFHTCHYTMDLPRYESREIFKEKLELSIKTILDGNLIGTA